MLVWLVAGLLGTANGLAINDFSSPLAIRGLVGVIATAGVLAATAAILRLDPRTRLRRYSSRVFLPPAAIAAAVAVAFNSGANAGLLSAVAAILVVGAVLLASGLETAAVLLASTMTIGLGVAVVRYGITAIAHLHVLTGLAILGYGAAVIGYWTALQAGRRGLGLAAAIVGGAAVITFGVELLAGWGMRGGAAFIGLGLAAIGYEIAMAADQRVVAGVAAIGGGLAVIGLAVTILGGRGVVGELAFVGLGLAAIGYGMTLAADRQVLGGVAAVGGGIAAIAAGAALLADQQVLGGTATVGGGVAIIVLGVVLIDPAAITARIRQIRATWIEVPESLIERKSSRHDAELILQTYRNALRSRWLRCWEPKWEPSSADVGDPQLTEAVGISR